MKVPVIGEAGPERVIIQHIAHHFFQGVCICSCRVCTHHSGAAMQCVCADCPADRCGLKTARIFGTHS